MTPLTFYSKHLFWVVIEKSVGLEAWACFPSDRCHPKGTGAATRAAWAGKRECAVLASHHWDVLSHPGSSFIGELSCCTSIDSRPSSLVAPRVPSYNLGDVRGGSNLAPSLIPRNEDCLMGDLTLQANLPTVASFLFSEWTEKDSLCWFGLLWSFSSPGDSSWVLHFWTAHTHICLAYLLVFTFPSLEGRLSHFGGEEKTDHMQVACTPLARRPWRSHCFFLSHSITKQRRCHWCCGEGKRKPRIENQIKESKIAVSIILISHSTR